MLPLRVQASYIHYPWNLAIQRQNASPQKHLPASVPLAERTVFSSRIPYVTGERFESLKRFGGWAIKLPGPQTYEQEEQNHHFVMHLSLDLIFERRQGKCSESKLISPQSLWRVGSENIASGRQ